MRAVLQHEFGGPEVLRVADVPAPEPLPTEVQVRVAYAGVNPVDAKTREGASVAPAMGGFPMTVGWDVAGVVTKLGAGVNRFEVGDLVFGMPHFPRACRAYAEYVTAPSRQLVRVPEGLDLATAAAVPLPATTAYQIVEDIAQPQAGQTVLVLAAGGSVGRIAVRLAVLRGAVVVGTDHTAKLSQLEELGVAAAIDYTSERFEDRVAAMDVDVVIDFVGGDHTRRALSVARQGGLVVSVPSGMSPELREEAQEAGVRLTNLIVEPDRLALEHVARLLAVGELDVPKPEVFPFSDVVAVHRALAQGGRKMVLEVAP